MSVSHPFSLNDYKCSLRNPEVAFIFKIDLENKNKV
jgi:hypothetical protein